MTRATLPALLADIDDEILQSLLTGMQLCVKRSEESGQTQLLSVRQALLHALECEAEFRARLKALEQAPRS